MTLSPTALEAAAKAISVSTGDEPHKLTYAHEMQCTGRDREPKYRWQYWTEQATAAITAYLAQAGKEGWVMVPVEPIGWFNPWNDYHGFQQVAEEYEGGDGVYPFYANQKAHDDLAAAQNGGE